MLAIQGYEFTVLTDALQDAHEKWEKVRQDIVDGTNPNASLEGCDLILGDVRGLLSKLKELE